MVNAVRKLRRAQDVTQEELAKVLGVSRQTIIKIEQGQPTADVNVIKLSYFFNKDAREIFFLDSVPSSLQETVTSH